MKVIYLDNSMTTRPSEAAVSAMMPFLTDDWGSPSAPHQLGASLSPHLRQSYQHLLALLGGSEDDTLIFTSSGAEAINHAMMSCYLNVTLNTGKNQFITSNCAEAPMLMMLDRLNQFGSVATTVPVNSLGQVSVEALGDVITPRTAMVSLSWANGLTGVLQPIEEVGLLCQERGIIFHVDATHILGKLYYDLTKLNVDMVSFNGDHIHAPKGTGALWVRSGEKVSPFIIGGLEQAGLRGGSFSMGNFVALGIAAKECVECRDLLCMETARLRDKLEEGLLKEIPDACVFFQEQQRLPHCLTMGFPGISNEALLFLLDRQGVAASIGGGSFQQISLLLQHAAVDKALSQQAISFSLSRETREEEIECAVTTISRCVKQLRKTSNYFSKEV